MSLSRAVPPWFEQIHATDTSFQPPNLHPTRARHLVLWQFGITEPRDRACRREFQSRDVAAAAAAHYEHYCYY